MTNALGPRVRVVSAPPKKDFSMEIVFENGEKRTVDLAPYLQGPIFKPLQDDSEACKRIKIEGGALAWDNGADIDPDVLYYQLPPVGRVVSVPPSES